MPPITVSATLINKYKVSVDQPDKTQAQEYVLELLNTGRERQIFNHDTRTYYLVSLDTEYYHFALPRMEDCTFKFEYDSEQDINLAHECEEMGMSNRQIQALLDRAEHDLSAWFMVECICTWRGMSESSFLGGCIYESFAEFESDPSADQMKQQAYQNLLNQLRSLGE